MKLSFVTFLSGERKVNNEFCGPPAGGKPHIITSAFEHHCILDTCKILEKENLIELTILKPNQEGIVNSKDIQKAIKINTILVSIMYVNDEIGTVQPIEKIGKLIENESLKNSMGEKAREKALKDYTNQNSHSEEYYSYLKSKL